MDNCGQCGESVPSMYDRIVTPSISVELNANTWAEINRGIEAIAEEVVGKGNSFSVDLNKCRFIKSVTNNLYLMIYMYGCDESLIDQLSPDYLTTEEFING